VLYSEHVRPSVLLPQFLQRKLQPGTCLAITQLAARHALHDLTAQVGLTPSLRRGGIALARVDQLDLRSDSLPRRTASSSYLALPSCQAWTTASSAPLNDGLQALCRR